MIKIYQGQSLSFEWDTVPKKDLSGFACKVQVKDENGIGLLTRDITTMSSDNKAFAGSFTKEDTQSWTVGLCKICVELTNDITNESAPFSKVIRVLEDPIKN